MEWLFGEDCGTRLLDRLDELWEFAQPLLNRNLKMRVTSKVKERLRKQLNCHVCERALSTNDRHIDHDHMTGKVSFLANLSNLFQRAGIVNYESNLKYFMIIIKYL